MSNKETKIAIVTVSSCYKDCSEMLPCQNAKEKADNLYKML